jgi:F0F1-type ATP synthase beta subunit
VNNPSDKQAIGTIIEVHGPVVSIHKGVSVFAGIGERIREAHELWREMQQAGVMDDTLMVFGQTGVSVPLAQTLNDCEGFLSGRYDAVSEEQCYMRGAMPTEP